MRVTVIGTGFIGSTLGRALVHAGHTVTFGTRGDPTKRDLPARAVPVDESLATSDVVILAVPANAIAQLAREHEEGFAGKLVIDATNRIGQDVANSRADLPRTIRYVRAFNTLGGENFADPVFPGGTADLFFSASSSDRATVEELIAAVGLRPIFVGEDQEALIDALFRLWIQLAMVQGRGRHLALRLLED